jgi:putative ABC transport system permease protein
LSRGARSLARCVESHLDISLPENVATTGDAAGKTARATFHLFANDAPSAIVTSGMGTLASDIRYAFRMLAKNPGFATIAILALALGIGVNTAIFTVVNAVLLQPLPYPEPDRIVEVARGFPDGRGNSVSIPKYMVWKDNHVFQAMTLYAFAASGMNLGAGDRPEQVKAAQVSSGFFEVFGVSPALGRTFTASEDVPNGPAVAVLTHEIWQSRLGGDQRVIGGPVLLNGQAYTVLGVLPKGFRADPQTDVFLPLQADPHSTNQGHYLNIAARLKPGVTLSAARAEMKIAGERFRKDNPKWMNKDETVAVTPLREAAVSDIKTALLVLLGAVGFVLLIACANVANLLLARAAARQREMAVRAALGAGRWRVVRQLLTESVLLAGIGGALGFALGSWGVRALLLLVPANIPRLMDADGVHAIPPPLDWRVAVFTLAAAMLTGVLFGLIPALQASKLDLVSTLKEAGSRSGTSRRHNRARSSLVVAEVALALVLVAGAALLIRTFVGLSNAQPGIDPHNVLTMMTSLTGGAYSSTGKIDAFATDALRRIESLPGVEAAATMVFLPAGSYGIDMPFNIAGKPPAKGDQYNGDEQYRYVAGHYFQVFRIPLLRGRRFTDTDTGNSAAVVIVNQQLAKHYWPNQDPIGQVITIGQGLGPQFADPPRQVVGVVGTVKEAGVANGDVGVMYLPQSQVPQGLMELARQIIPLAWAVRSPGDPMALRTAVQREIQAVDGAMTVSRFQPMEKVMALSVARQNFNMLLLTIFAVIALLLAAIGIYGVMSYSVQQRTQEIGIRMALGSSRTDVLKLMLGHGLKLAGIGVAIGLALAYLLTRFLASLLFSVKAGDPWTLAAVAAILTLVALIATYIPARRAAATDPGQALHYQ